MAQDDLSAKTDPSQETSGVNAVIQKIPMHYGGEGGAITNYDLGTERGARDFRHTTHREVRIQCSPLTLLPRGLGLVGFQQEGGTFHLPLEGADLSRSRFVNVSFGSTNLTKCVFQRAYFQGCHFSGGRLADCDFYRADFLGTTFGETNLSGSGPFPWGKSNDELAEPERDAEGLLFYKGVNPPHLFTGGFSPREEWEPPALGIRWEETGLNPSRDVDCASGIHIAYTPQWVRGNYPTRDVWKVRVAWRDIQTLVFPLNYPGRGKARVARITFVEKVYDAVTGEVAPTYRQRLEPFSSLF